MELLAPRLKKYSLSCSDREWEEVKERARRAGQSTSAYLVQRALTVRLVSGAEPGREEALVLTEPEQRALADRVTRIAEIAEAGGERGDTLIQRIERGIAFLVETRMREMLAAGETAELEAIAEELFGARGRSGVRAWIARRTPLDRSPP